MVDSNGMSNSYKVIHIQIKYRNANAMCFYFILFQNVFSNDDIKVYPEYVLKHMHELRVNWRADFKRYNIITSIRSL